TTLTGYGIGTTGTGSAVQATSPTLVTPALGTPSSAVLTNATGLPVGTGLSGLGTGAATALGLGVNTSGGMWLGDSDLAAQPVTIPGVGPTQLGTALANPWPIGFPLRVPILNSAPATAPGTGFAYLFLVPGPNC